jgi:hypothetical protein
MVIVTTAVYWRLSSPLHHDSSRVPLTFQHRAGVSPYTSPYSFARTCVFSKQSLPALLCDPPQLDGLATSPGRVPLLPKLRGHFAEFLDHSSPERLGILYQTTCVGLGYGPTRTSLEAFLDSTGTAASPLRAPHHTSAYVSRGFAYGTAHMLGPGQPPPGTACLPASPHHSPTTDLGHRPPPPSPEGSGSIGGLSVIRFGPCGTRRVREYQPVIHRLRLTASP